ncbi:MAG: ATP-dependent DNA helicase RecQ, partial [Treponema sp.]|nr:ATP-dependent DNA helicase RecQ [Treponema sp.]
CCDVCENKAEKTLREELSTFDFFRRNKRRFTSDEAASVLSGSETVRWSEQDATQVISYLIKTGRLKKTRKFPWKNNLTT